MTRAARDSAARASARAGTASTARRAARRTCPVTGSARTAPSRPPRASPPAGTPSTKSCSGSSPADHRCAQLECARSTGSRSRAMNRTSGIAAWMRRSAAVSCRYSDVDSPEQRAGRRVGEQRLVLVSLPHLLAQRLGVTGPALGPRPPLVRKYFGSFTRERYSWGWRASATCSAVVPAFGAPAMRKSGSAIGGHPKWSRRRQGRCRRPEDCVARFSACRRRAWCAARGAPSARVTS